jgi:DNA (cytosine-5)-methyltransferase 1
VLGPRGGVKVSPAFGEWLMGLPEGHITDVPDLSINEQLKLVGNGVVPQQAEHAIRWLWNQLNRPALAAA